MTECRIIISNLIGAHYRYDTGIYFSLLGMTRSSGCANKLIVECVWNRPVPVDSLNVRRCLG